MLDTILFSPCLARIDERASKLRIPAESFANKAAAERVPEIGYRHRGPWREPRRSLRLKILLLHFAVLMDQSGSDVMQKRGCKDFGVKGYFSDNPPRRGKPLAAGANRRWMLCYDGSKFLFSSIRRRRAHKGIFWRRAERRKERDTPTTTLARLLSSVPSNSRRRLRYLFDTMTALDRGDSASLGPILQKYELGSNHA